MRALGSQCQKFPQPRFLPCAFTCTHRIQLQKSDWTLSVFWRKWVRVYSICFFTDIFPTAFVVSLWKIGLLWMISHKDVARSTLSIVCLSVISTLCCMTHFYISFDPFFFCFKITIICEIRTKIYDNWYSDKS